MHRYGQCSRSTAVMTTLGTTRSGGSSPTRSSNPPSRSHGPHRQRSGRPCGWGPGRWTTCSPLGRYARGARDVRDPWLDLRRLPVRVDAAGLGAQYVGATIRTDGVMLWFILDGSGLHLRCRYPDTPKPGRTSVGGSTGWSPPCRRAPARQSAEFWSTATVRRSACSARPVPMCPRSSDCC